MEVGGCLRKGVKLGRCVKSEERKSEEVELEERCGPRKREGFLTRASNISGPLNVTLYVSRARWILTRWDSGWLVSLGIELAEQRKQAVDAWQIIDGVYFPSHFGAALATYAFGFAGREQLMPHDV